MKENEIKEWSIELRRIQMEGIETYFGVGRGSWSVLAKKGVGKEILKFRYFMIALKRINNTH